jgi:hypothetical protein
MELRQLWHIEREKHARRLIAQAEQCTETQALRLARAWHDSGFYPFTSASAEVADLWQRAEPELEQAAARDQLARQTSSAVLDVFWKDTWAVNLTAYGEWASEVAQSGARWTVLAMLAGQHIAGIEAVLAPWNYAFAPEAR